MSHEAMNYLVNQLKDKDEALKDLNVDCAELRDHIAELTRQNGEHRTGWRERRTG